MLRQSVVSAIIQSTLWDTAITASEISDASAAAEMFLARAGVKPGEIDKLQAMPQERLIDALTAPGDISTRYVPVKDGQTLTVHPFEPTASALSASVPMMCGSNETESVPYANPEDPFWTSEIADEAALRDSVKRAIRNQ
jgi:para-nitrobenzyl esterase